MQALLAFLDTAYQINILLENKIFLEQPLTTKCNFTGEQLSAINIHKKIVIWTYFTPEENTYHGNFKHLQPIKITFNLRNISEIKHFHHIISMKLNKSAVHPANRGIFHIYQCLFYVMPANNQWLAFFLHMAAVKCMKKEQSRIALQSSIFHSQQ